MYAIIYHHQIAGESSNIQPANKFFGSMANIEYFGTVVTNVALGVK
jgi:hypothetical protein